MARRVYSASTSYQPASLRAASRIVDMLLKGRVYDVDVDLMPTDPDVAAAMAEATEAIAAEVEALGTLEAGSTQQWESVAIGSVQLSNLQGASAADPLLVMGVQVPPAALLALGDVGVFTYTVGAPGYVRPLDRVAQ